MHFRFDIKGELLHKSSKPGKNDAIYRACTIAYGTGSERIEFRQDGVGQQAYQQLLDEGQHVRVQGVTRQLVFKGEARLSCLADRVAAAGAPQLRSRQRRDVRRRATEGLRRRAHDARPNAGGRHSGQGRGGRVAARPRRCPQRQDVAQACSSAGAEP